ncbi:MAG TPA: hypothetical protein DCE33_09210 [Rhodospirillaceae bacterium]|nr:hypothetical protein [Rhodospirillaceae bacterium]
MSSSDKPTDNKAKAYEAAKKLSGAKGLKARLALAGNEDTNPEILSFLATDPDPGVRREAARNEATPGATDLVLAGDADETVRVDLARKIARLTPELSAEQRGTLYNLTVEILEVLVRDQIVQVRTILSDALKDFAEAPPSIIRQLALDREIDVSGPVLEFSPVLNDQDLIEIINSAPVQGALAAISRRNGIETPVTDAIAGTGDRRAIAEMLANRSAQIREQTLDEIIDSAPSVEIWHAPLVHRPGLPVGAARKIAGFIADNLLTELRDRRDLSADAIAAVAQVVEDKLGDQSETPSQEKDDPSFAARRVRAMIERGDLNESEVFDALQNGDPTFTIAALAIRAELPEALVHHALRLRSAKGIVAIAHKAGFSMHLATALQLQLAGIPPKAILKPDSDGGFPLDNESMEWQLEFLAGSQR